MSEKLPRNLKSGSANEEERAKSIEGNKKLHEIGIAQYADSTLPTGFEAADFELSKEQRLDLQKTLKELMNRRLDAANALEKYMMSVNDKKISDKLAIKLTEASDAVDRVKRQLTK